MSDLPVVPRRRNPFCRWLVLPALVLAACSDSQSPTDPPPSTDPPVATTGSFDLELPATIYAGQAFSLTVIAVATNGTRPDTGFSGSVTLSTSVGALTPASIEVTNGTGTAEVTLTNAAGPISIGARAGDATGTREVIAIGNAPVARIELSPSLVTLTGAGQTQQLTASAFDAAGLPTQADITWSSTNTAAVSIDAEGVLTAVAPLGSAQILAQADGVTSNLALALIANPADGAVLVPDTAVVGSVTSVDDPADFGIGWRYQVRLRGLTVQPGQIVVGTGEQPVGGRVVSVTAAGDESDVVLELIPLPELIPGLQIDETIPLVAASEEAQPSPSTGPSRVEFKLGRFKCDATGSLPSLDLPDPKLDITPSLALKVGYATPGGGLQSLTAVGGIATDFAYNPIFKAVFEGKVDCNAKLRTLILPIGGWFSFFFGAQVPVGAGLTLDGKLDIAEVGFDVKANATATVELGLDCPAAGCSTLNTFDLTRDGSFELIAPDPTDQFKLTLGGHAYLWAKLTLGSPLSASLQFEAMAAKAGLKQSVDLATAHKQVSDPAYASTFRLAFLAEVGSGSDLDKAIEKLGKLLGRDLNLDLDLLDIDETLAESPKGTFTITPPSVAPGNDQSPGETATFTVDLDPVTYLGLESVDEVEIFWKQDDGQGGFTLEPGRPGCTDISGASGQKKFECQTDFLEEHEGEQTFYAFVHAKLFGAPLPIPLEVADDGVASVLVASMGNVRVHTLTTGMDLDPDGYAVIVDGDPKGTLGVNDQALYEDIPTGQKLVQLDGVAPNCNVTSANPQSVQITVNATVDVTFQIECMKEIAEDRIVFTNLSDILSMNPDGTDIVNITDNGAGNDDPSYSPDRSKIAYSGQTGSASNIFVKNTDGTGTATQLTFAASGYHADVEFSPDGSMISYNRDGDIYVMPSGGGSGTLIVGSPKFDANAEWHPGGGTLVFQSKKDDPDYDLYTTPAGGGAYTRITTSPGLDGDPTYSPDGSKILFRSDRNGSAEIWVMNAGGGGAVRLTAGEEPTWSPDGTRIAFVRGGIIWTANADGSSAVSTGVAGEEPVWR